MVMTNQNLCKFSLITWWIIKLVSFMKKGYNAIYCNIKKKTGKCSLFPVMKFNARLVLNN